jgi:excisionase family DNA binding protein
LFKRLEWGAILTQIEVYTISEAASLLKCSPALVRSLISNGHLAATNVSASGRGRHKNYRITGSAIARYLDNAAVPVRAARSSPKVYGRPFLKCNGA